MRFAGSCQEPQIQFAKPPGVLSLKSELFHNPRSQQQIRAEAAPLDIAQIEGFGKICGALACNRAAGVASAQNFRGIKKGDTLGQSLPQKGCIHLSATFDEQAGDVIGAELLQEPAEIEERGSRAECRARDL